MKNAIWQSESFISTTGSQTRGVRERVALYWQPRGAWFFSMHFIWHTPTTSLRPFNNLQYWFETKSYTAKWIEEYSAFMLHALVIRACSHDAQLQQQWAMRLSSAFGERRHKRVCRREIETSRRDKTHRWRLTRDTPRYRRAVRWMHYGTNKRGMRRHDLIHAFWGANPSSY